MQRKPCVSDTGDDWTWTQHDYNITCPACDTANPVFKSHQRLKVRDENTFLLLNPPPEDINTQKACDDKHDTARRGDAPPGASRGACPGSGPGAGGAGGLGGPAAGGPGGEGSTTRRTGRLTGFSSVSTRTTRSQHSRTSRGGTAETHDDTSPSKSKKESIRKFLHMKSKGTKSPAEIEARFQDMFAVHLPEQSGSRPSRLPYRPTTLPTSHSTNFNT